jgi:hypothetical protein
MSRLWLIATVPAFAGGLALLAKMIMRLIAHTRASRVAAVPLAAEARVSLPAGPLELAMEARRLSRDFAGVTFTLHRAGAGQEEVPLRRLLFRTEVSGFERVRLSLFALEARGPGDYLLRASGVGAPEPESQVVFVRPMAAKLVLHVLALIGIGAVLIGSIVLSALALGG